MAKLFQSRWLSGALVTQPVSVAGQTFYVDNTYGSNSFSGRSWKKPFSTLNYAISNCSDDSGDVIFIAPYHAETIEDDGTESGTTTDELIIDKAGIQIFGLGHGALRPTFTLATDVDATIVVTAGTTNVVLSNIIVISAKIDLVSGMELTGTSDGMTIQNCTFRSGAGGSLEMKNGIKIAADCDDVSILNNEFTAATGGNETAVILAGASHRLHFIGNYCQGTFSVCALKGSVAASTDMIIAHNVFTNQGQYSVNLSTTCTGIIANNIIAGTTNMADSFIGSDAMYCCENYITGEDGRSGAIDPGLAS